MLKQKSGVNEVSVLYILFTAIEFTVIVFSHMPVWGKWNTAFRDYVGKNTFFFGINVRWSHCNDFTLHFYDVDNLTY